ncbi:endonuclease III [Flavobacterium sufflavum]|uniref:Endonuclease III n=1 Tax=Flavobacterium sufflavum TaxID=1921138 RepID=A0A437KTK7_9FLAO|nr:endonuclease III [Flavobacterium sufflavum]RVT75427.1 endonuclease III [Flavobacterium sufflavum]
MDLFSDAIDWKEELNPILKKYKSSKHPLKYRNLYELVIMVILSAQDSDENINKITPNFFDAFPEIKSLAKSKVEAIIPYIHKVKFYENKAEWIINLAKTIKKDENIPLTIRELTDIKGIGRKSANVIMRESNIPSEGIITDLHVLRVAPRIGIISPTKDGIKAEKQLMTILPREIWNEIGMAISFLGREICRPIPKCFECPINSCCKYPKKNFMTEY